MARYECPQCGRGFGSVGDVLSHTQEVHSDDAPRDAVAEPTITSRSMPSAEPGPVATERASETEFETESAGANESASGRSGPKPKDEGSDQQNPTLGTLIALIVIAAIIILNIIGGAGE